MNLEYSKTNNNVIIENQTYILFKKDRQTELYSSDLKNNYWGIVLSLPENLISFTGKIEDHYRVAEAKKNTVYKVGGVEYILNGIKWVEKEKKEKEIFVTLEVVQEKDNYKHKVKVKNHYWMIEPNRADMYINSKELKIRDQNVYLTKNLDGVVVDINNYTNWNLSLNSSIGRATNYQMNHFNNNDNSKIKDGTEYILETTTDGGWLTHKNKVIIKNRLVWPISAFKQHTKLI